MDSWIESAGLRPRGGTHLKLRVSSGSRASRLCKTPNFDETKRSSRLGRAATCSTCEKERAMGRRLESSSAAAGGLGQRRQEPGSGCRA